MRASVWLMGLGGCGSWVPGRAGGGVGGLAVLGMMPARWGPLTFLHSLRARMVPRVTKERMASQGSL